MRILKHLLLPVFALLCVQQISAQRKTISGTVKDNKGAPIEGATVKIRSIRGGTSTDKDGNFSLTVSPADVLEIISVGFKTKTVPVKGGVFDISLEASVEELQELVLVGTRGTARSSI